MRNAIVLTLVIAVGVAALASTPGGSNAIPKIMENVLFQDFENPTGWNGSNPPLGWIVADNGQTDGIWDSYDWSRYAAWGGGTARVSGSSANRYNNDWLISPAVDFTSATACSLAFRHYYDDYLTQEADSALVLLSNDDGATWGDTVIVYAGADYGSDTVPDSEYFDISAFASGHSAIKVAFQYVKRQAVVTGSWRIDDVQLRADGSSLLSQNFDSGWGPNGDNPPANWTILDVQVTKWDNNDWHQTNIGGWGNIAEVYWSPVERQNEFLISPSMDFSDGTHNIHLFIKQWYEDRPDEFDTAYVLGSINGGVTWPETLAVYRGTSHGSLSTPAYDTLNMLDWANNQADVKIGFKYVGVNDGRWYLDSIGVDRNNMFSNDVMVDSIIAPTGIIVEGYWWPVSALVQNVGIYTNSFQAVFQIFDSIGAMVYADSQSITSLPSLEQRTVNFDPWRAGEPNDHPMRCFTRMYVDMDPTNDTVNTSEQVYHHIGQAGPSEGWFYKDNISGGGQLYDWIDIRSVGTSINFSDPDNGNSGMIDMEMDFFYFWQNYSRIAVSTDGWLSFEDSTGADNTPSAIPDIDGPAAMIALLWADLNIQTGHAYYYHDGPSNQFIIQYDSIEYASIPGSDLGMEIIFDGNENSIKMQYSYFTAGPEYEGTVGLENQAQDLGLPYDNNGQIGQTPQAGLAITYTYLPPHDVMALSIDQPNFLIHNGSSYDIVANIRNVGANIESFEVTAIDDHGWSNTQLVSDLASLDMATVTFPSWTISSECSTYTLEVFCNLGEDLNRYNDTVMVKLDATAAANLAFIYDDDIVYTGITTNDTADVMATELNTPYENTILSAVAYKFLNTNASPPDPQTDSIVASVFIDANSDGVPDLWPIYSKRLELATSGWTIWNIGCDTTLTINCNNIWVGCSIEDSVRADTINVDRNLDYPGMKWARELGQWHLLGPTFGGDYMIRAFVSTDTSTGPRIVLGNRQLIGAAPPDGVDTVSTYIQNMGASCNLSYQVSVRQTGQRILRQQDADLPILLSPDGKPAIISLDRTRYRISDPPRILDSGGPDNFGHTWIDSDSPTGPAYGWIDISALGTLVAWDHGDYDDGYTEPIPMGMTFNFYGANRDSVTISTNGWVSFKRPPDDPFAFSANAFIPFPLELSDILAVEWDNLTGGPTGRCYYYHDVAANAFIISWLGWSHVPGGVEPHNFQVILDGNRGTILFQYSGQITQADVTIGIENADDTDGLLVVYNQPYLHNNLAILFKLPIFWLSTDLANGILPPGSDQLPFNVIMNAIDLPGGTYNGSIVINNNDADEAVATIDVQFQIEGVCSYVVGDVNGDGHTNGLDVVFMVLFFKGGNPPHDECPQCQDQGPNMLYPQGDVNGSCSWNGLDVTYFVSYLKGMWPSLHYCDLCPPGGKR